VGEAGADGNEPTIAIAFVPAGTIYLTTKDPPVELTVQTSPPGQFPIRFALSGIDANTGIDGAADAVLDASDIVTDADGVGHVNLYAPSKPASFNVLASSPSAGNNLFYQGVKVDATGMTTLSVRPSYVGNRSISKWTASVKAGVSCSDLSGNPPPDGDHPVSEVPDVPLVLKQVPVGVNLAVTVRAGHYIGGCANVPALSEGDGNQVLVYASDRALNLSATNLTLSMGASDAHPAFDKLLQSSVTLAESALLGGAKTDLGALLDDMREASSNVDRDAFDAARLENDWEGALASTYGKGGARRMRDPALRWLSAGLAALNAPNALIGRLSPLGVGVTFVPSSVGPASPSDAGFTGFFVAKKWSADSNDIVQLSMELNWEPSRLVTALAIAPARAEFPDADSVERALALSVDCAQVGQVLMTAGASPGIAAFASCDEVCTVSACESAVAAAWNRAQQSTGAEIDTLDFTATAKAQVGDDARATALSGSWVGELSTNNGTAQVSGALSAK